MIMLQILDMGRYPLYLKTFVTFIKNGQPTKDFTKKGKIFFIFRQDPSVRMITFHYFTKILRRVSYTAITAPKDLIRKHYIFKTIRPMETILTFLEISKERLHFTFYGHGEKTSLSSEKIRQNTFFCRYLRIF